jgi:hypothetical protein
VLILGSECQNLIKLQGSQLPYRVRELVVVKGKNKNNNKQKSHAFAASCR